MGDATDENAAHPAKSRISHSTLRIQTLQSLPTVRADEALRQIKSIEKKTFPASEAWDFGPTTTYKQNTQVYCVFQGFDEGKPPIAYAVCTRARKTLFVHKLCVAAPYRGAGVGQMLLTHIQGKADAEKCRQIDLWVDESRVAARALYLRCGFEERKKSLDYYAPGRHALSMTYELKS